MAKVDDKLRDTNAEKAVIGGLLVDPSVIGPLSEMLSPDDFYSEGNRWIYEAALQVREAGSEVDYITIADALDGHLAAIGGTAKLTELVGATPTAVNVLDHARVVNRLATLRRLMVAAQGIAKLAYSSEDDSIAEVFAKARGLVDSVAPEAEDDALLLWIDSFARFIEYQIERKEQADAIQRGERVARAGFPWKAITRLVSFIRPGMLAIVAADTSVGKTTFMECCAEHWARCGLQIVFYHLELPHRFMLDRRICRWSGEPMHSVEAGEITDAIKEAHTEAKSWTGHVHYMHVPGWSAPRICNSIRQMRNKGRCDVAVIDYLQKMRLIRQKGQNDASAIGDQVEVVKNTCEQLDIPAIMGSQLSREGNIRNSGEPEEKANIIIYLEREKLMSDMHSPDGRVVAKEGERSPEIKGRVEKNTGGACGAFELVMNGARYNILDVGQDEPQPPPSDGLYANF